MIAAAAGPSRVRRGALVLSLAALFGVFVLFEVPLCPSATLFGVPCPGCGLTRATLALLSGDVRRAFELHPLVFVLAPLFVGALVLASADYVRGTATATRAWITGRWATRIAWGVLVLVLGVWGARFLGWFGGPAPVRSVAPWADEPLFKR